MLTTLQLALPKPDHEYSTLVIRPLINRLADEIVRQNEVDSIQNWTLVGLVGAVGVAIIFALAYQYLRKKAFAKIAAGQAPGIPLAPQNAIRRTNQDLEADV